MNTEQFDLKQIELALRKFLFESPTPEKALVVVLQNPLLLTNFVDNLFESLIKDAKSRGNEELVKLYRGHHTLLQAIRQALSKKDIALLFAAKQILAKKDIANASLISMTIPESLEDFQEIIAKMLVWLKAPTLEQGINILQQHPELLTEQPIKVFGWFIEEACKQGDEVFVQLLRTLREFFQSVRVALIDKDSATISTEELTQAVKQALVQTDFSAFTEKRQAATLLA